MNKFVIFLKNNNCVEEFEENLKTDGEFKNIKDLMENCEPKDYICSAFNLDDSFEGKEYWETINRRWLALLGRAQTSNC